jgi:hypothetical protein
MVGKTYSSTELDSDGRKFVLSDNILHVRYYDNSLEVWDKAGANNQSWYTEVFSPNDTFGAEDINTDRWSLHGPSTRTLTQSNGSLVLGVERDDGSVYVSSDGKWRLTGDFDIRLYIDWASYYNEYRSLTRTFMKVGVDDSNAVRVSFAFNGSNGYNFASEKTVSRDIRYFDWKKNGDTHDVDDIGEAATWAYLRVTRDAGVIRTYISDGETTAQVGSAIADAVFSQDVYIDLGLESREFNTYRHNFTKFYVVSGTSEPYAEFFSAVRGRRQDFPQRVIATVDTHSLSLIDEDNSKLWMRFLIGDPELLPDTNLRVSACNGTIYCATSGGLVAFDFVQDKIFRYKDSEIQVADETIALRDAGVTFRTFAAAAGTMSDNNIHDVACRQVGSEDYLAMVHGTGVTVRRALASGVSNSTDGPEPGSIVSISEKGALYWAAYSPVTNTGEVSYYSNVAALAITGTTTFSRSGYYGTATSLRTVGEVITCLDVRTVEGFDQLVVGTTEGLSFLGQNPVRGTTYGVEANAVNPFTDTSFENHIGMDWIPFHNGFIRRANMLRKSDWSTVGDYSLYLRYYALPNSSHVLAGTNFGVYQDVDLTGVERIYFDINFTPVGGANDVWEFQVVVDDIVVKSYGSSEGPFIKLTDSANVLEYDGQRRVLFRIYFPTEVYSNTSVTDYSLYLDNIQTAIGNPVHRVLPPGNAAIKEALVQYDTQGHKIYFATAEGFGAIDLDVNSLDYFTKLETLVPDPDTENLSGEFARIEDEV